MRLTCSKNSDTKRSTSTVSSRFWSASTNLALISLAPKRWSNKSCWSRSMKASEAGLFCEFNYQFNVITRPQCHNLSHGWRLSLGNVGSSLVGSCCRRCSDLNRTAFQMRLMQLYQRHSKYLSKQPEKKLSFWLQTCVAFKGSQFWATHHFSGGHIV